MMLPQCSHITRKRGIYYYRRRLPSTANREITISLKTRSYRAAEAAALMLNEAFIDFFATAHMKPFNVSAALRSYLKKRLDSLRVLHLETPYGRPFYRFGRDGSEGDVHDDIPILERQISQFKSDIRRRDIRPVEPIIKQLTEGYELSKIQRVEFGLGLLQVNIQLAEQSREWLTNGLVSRIDLWEPPQTTQHEEVSVNATEPGPTFSQILPEFLNLMVQDQGWRRQTLAQNKTTYRMFEECCGDRPITSYERKDLAKFYDLLRALPKFYSKSKEWMGLTLQQIAERSKSETVERVSMKTVKRHMSALGRLFAYLKRRGEYVGENPAHGFEYPDKRRAREKRRMWEGERLRKLFESPVWSGSFSEARRSRPGSLIIRDEKYWLPLLGLFHGNRLEEFAQLRRGDVRHEEGLWFLDINDEDTKQVKNEQSKRRVPIHPYILSLGFIDYVENIAKKPNDLLFPRLRPGGPDNKLGFSFTKWWTRYRQDIGLYEKGLDYHSFRHGVATKLAAAGVSLDVRNELLGHEGSSVDERVYQKGLPLRVLADAIKRVKWPEITLIPINAV